jgi:hypothetical protein
MASLSGAVTRLRELIVSAPALPSTVSLTALLDELESIHRDDGDPFSAAVARAVELLLEAARLREAGEPSVAMHAAALGGLDVMHAVLVSASRTVVVEGRGVG